MASLIWALFMLLLPLISAEGSFTVPATYNHGYVPDASTSWARALRRWGTEPRGLKKIAAQKGQSVWLKSLRPADVPSVLTSSNPVGNATAKTNQRDLEYLTLVGFGTPPQYLPMNLDTGSVDVWVCSTGMTSRAIANRTVYNPNNSSTAVLLPNTTWWIVYGK